MAESSSVLILGAGAWGTSFASRMANIKKNKNIFLWCRNSNLASKISTDKINQRYLPEIKISDYLTISSDLQSLIVKLKAKKSCNNYLVLAVPSSSISQVCDEVSKLNFCGSYTLISLSKGVVEIDDQLNWSSQVIANQFSDKNICVLSGPSFAKEVALGLPFAMTCASKEIEKARRVATFLSGGGFRIYASDDPLGVEVAGAMKNVLAIASGVCDGMNLGHNARASLITRGLAETARLGIALGANPKTFIGLASLGDLVLTTTGNLSRNRKVGIEIAAGKQIDQILSELGHVAEGVFSAPKLLKLGKSMNVALPITSGVCSLLEGSKSFQEVLGELLSRNQSDEI